MIKPIRVRREGEDHEPFIWIKELTVKPYRSEPCRGEYDNDASPPLPVLQTGRVLARREALNYNFALENLGDYYLVLYFAGILPVSPTFDILINGEVVESNYSVNSWQVGSLYLLAKGINNLNITFKDITF
ncbi:hypothetical protein L2E82_08685 [Cichorium intybus]|uniref:Uncharacterized protein n=1 Tax=Cichorium intybus TaxID=13427 RepID=A0ACB9G7F5_CICIN|nr:hypothetical protein L2E82_08685 [Cichorium intybus]